MNHRMLSLPAFLLSSVILFNPLLAQDSQAGACGQKVFIEPDSNWSSDLAKVFERDLGYSITSNIHRADYVATIREDISRHEYGDRGGLDGDVVGYVPFGTSEYVLKVKKVAENKTAYFSYGGRVSTLDSRREKRRELHEIRQKLMSNLAGKFVPCE